jgi:putative ABC transport system ATP-binding protein
VIEIRSVSKTYREGETRRAVFRSLSASFGKGEFTCITGRSGSGKSTLLNLISGIDLPDEGQICIDGTDIVALGDRDRTLVRRRRIGFVFQFFNLIPTLTVEENLRLPLELNATEPQSWDERVNDLLERVSLADRRGSFPESLSGGEQQRIAVARALVHAPDILLADEPTGNLDRDTGRVVLDLMSRLARDKDATLLLVTHNSEVTAWADRVLHIDDGQLEPVSRPV